MVEREREIGEETLRKTKQNRKLNYLKELLRGIVLKNNEFKAAEFTIKDDLDGSCTSNPGF